MIDYALVVPFLLIYLLGMLIVTQRQKDTSIANFTWGGGVLLLTLLFFIISSHQYYSADMPWLRLRPLMITVLILLWAGRLALYVYLRYKGDDPRYKTWKRSGVTAFLLNFAYIFGLQPAMILIMTVPSYLIIKYSGYDLVLWDYIGLLVWCIGYYWESVSDYQLYRFTRNPANKGKVMRYGLWRYSRHPNYFGEVVMWWGIFLIAFNVSYGIYSLIAPVTITLLLLFVTGIPWVEQAMEKNPDYQEYKKHTSVFIPWFYSK